MNPLLRLRLFGVLFAFAIYAIDQWVKWLMVVPLQLRQKGVIDLLPFFDLRWTQNFGVSMGLFEADSMESRYILVGVTALIALVVTIWMFREKAWGDILGLSLILGFIGVKLIIHAMEKNTLPFLNDGQPIEGLPHITTPLSLGVIIGILVITTIASLIRSRMTTSGRAAEENEATPRH